tara:strand:- start:42 stop:365 length:324 start_codon:yes stop_codon:yes gene_type:complete
MKITNLPQTGSFYPKKKDYYEWKRNGHHLIVLYKKAEVKNSFYKVVIIFPGLEFSRDLKKEWYIRASLMTGGAHGVETDLDPESINLFDDLFNHFDEMYGKPEKVNK